MLIAAEKLKMIANEKNIDYTTLDGRIELLRIVLKSQSVKKASDFMIDTFMMIEDEIDDAFVAFGLDEEVA